MKENQNYDEVIDARELISALWRGKYFIIIFTMISLAAGSMYLRTISSKYRVSNPNIKYPDCRKHYYF